MKPGRWMACALLVATLALSGFTLGGCFNPRQAGADATAGAFDQLRAEVASIKSDLSDALKSVASDVTAAAKDKAVDLAVERIDKLGARLDAMEAAIRAKPESERTLGDGLMLAIIGAMQAALMAGRDKLTAAKRNATIRAAAAGGLKPS